MPLKRGPLKRGLVKHGLVKHGLVKHGLVKHGVAWVLRGPCGTTRAPATTAAGARTL
jgi:hypothetical protein